MHLMNIDLYRDADFLRECRLTDSAGEAIDLTGGTLECVVVDQPGSGANPLAPGVVTLVEPTDGRFNLFLDGASYSAFGSLQEPVQAYYRVRFTKAGVQTNVLTGYITLWPGV